MGRANSSSYRQRFRHVFTINMSEWLPEWDDVIFIEWTFRKWEENNRFYFSSILHNNGFICAVVILGRRRDRSGSPPLVIIFCRFSSLFLLQLSDSPLFFFFMFHGRNEQGSSFYKGNSWWFCFSFSRKFFPQIFLRNICFVCLFIFPVSFLLYY